MLQTAKRLSQTEPSMRRALAIDEKSFGPEHPSVARDLGTLPKAHNPCADNVGNRGARAPGKLSTRKLAHRLLGGFLALLGAIVAAGGGWLLVLGGSWYYALAGTALAISGGLTFMGRPGGFRAYLIYFLGTAAWAVWEVGLSSWLLMPRILAPAVLGSAFLYGWLWSRATTSFGPRDSPSGGAARLLTRWPSLKRTAPTMAVGAVAAAGLLLLWEHTVFSLPLGPMNVERSADVDPLGEWRHYGNTLKGQRYSSLQDISPENVSQLRVAWTYRTGEDRERSERPSPTFEATPLKVGDALYLCTARNVVIALDPETGEELWRFDPLVRVHSRVLTCRGVSYHGAGPAAEQRQCARRILTATNDARLIALDAETGQLCADFGENGTVDLTRGLGEVRPGHYRVTSPPTIVGNLAVLGAYVIDHMSLDTPSGVIRAFDVTTGALAWNWDPAHPDVTEPLSAGENYTRSSPNSWGPGSADEGLGLVYLPMGVQGPDTWGGARNPLSERFSSAVVALEAQTGRVRWVYQTVHHDLWNLDIGAQPTLIDLATATGVRLALLVVTKRGDIFVLDRHDGQPIVPAPEKPVPQGAAPGDWVSPTQPFSELSFRPQTLTESDMWGVTPLDHLWCRIKFRRYRYEGIFTPQSVQGPGVLVYPGHYGVFNWGGAAVDEARQMLVVSPGYIASYSRLLRMEQASATPQSTTGRSPDHQPTNHGAEGRPQIDVPFTAELGPFLSPLGIPCQAPPWGYLAAVDVQSNRVLWQKKIGTTRDLAPFGMPLPLGVPSLGGPIVTASGLVFIAGTLDNYIRAFALDTGKELWRDRLPAGGQATPMTYRAKSGRQFVVMTAGGHSGLRTTPGDYVIAYALPRSDGRHSD